MITKKRHVALLEVLIAFALIVLCLLPIIYPQVAVVRAESKFIDTVELDHCVHLLFAQTLEKLYLNEIDWAEIENGKEIPIDHHQLEQVGCNHDLQYSGNVKFQLNKKKPPGEAEKSVYLYTLIFTFNDQGKGSSKPLIYEYHLTIERRIK